MDSFTLPSQFRNIYYAQADILMRFLHYIKGSYLIRVGKLNVEL